MLHFFIFLIEWKSSSPMRRDRLVSVPSWLSSASASWKRDDSDPWWWDDNREYLADYCHVFLIHVVASRIIKMCFPKVIREKNLAS